MPKSTKRPIYLLSPKIKEATIPLPMIEFQTTAKSIDFSKCDTLMFTSKQAVVTAEQIDCNWKSIPSIAIGIATKRQIEELGGRVIYHPRDFYGTQLADDIKEKFSKKKILYLRPKKISFDSRAYLAKSDIELQEQIIYQTTCVEYGSDRCPPPHSIIIFTSPSTIECFLNNFEWHSSYTAVVIGESTKVHLPKGCDFVVSDTPLIDSCIDRAMQLD
ncbi:Uroporphyrinogen-III synthase [hydrothermal vent metagenome]|uniref:uroporphyrinogen-III synthase n=1 Tax=hydrothermal vent metagenome TaxID=652676 RepID=A0A1W1CAC8_9ZZZZ